MSKVSSILLLHFVPKRYFNTVCTVTFPSASVSTVEFLTNSCQLSAESPTYAGRKLQLDEKSIKKYEATIGYLKSQGFENSQIVKLVSRQPWVLQSKVSNNLKPKFEFFQEIGVVGPLLPKLIASNPFIIRRSLDSHLKPSIFFLKEILESDKQVIAAICRSPKLLTFDIKGIVKPNVDVLISEGMPSRIIAKMISLQPLAIMQKVDRTIHAVKKVKELGLEPTARMFFYAFIIRVSMSESTWKKKIDVLKSLGWSEDEIFTAFKKDPFYLGCSEEKIRYVADFCFNTAKMDPGTVISHPMFFKSSVDKRLRPRYRVVQVLKTKNLLKNQKIPCLLTEGERRFLERYIIRHLDEIPNLMDIYRGNVEAEAEAETKSVL